VFANENKPYGAGGWYLSRLVRAQTVRSRKVSGCSSSDDLDAGRIAELTKHLFAILSCQTKGAHVGHAKTLDYGG
jgi:hypothetical protein